MEGGQSAGEQRVDGWVGVYIGRSARGRKGAPTHRGEVQVDAGDAAVGGRVPLRLEGRVPDQELVHEHAEAPDVHHGVVRAAL